MKVAVVKETFPGERRVALVPAGVAALTKAGCQVLLQRGAGFAAGFADAEYEEKGAQLVGSRADLSEADAILQLRCAGANGDGIELDLQHVRGGQTVIGMCDPLGHPAAVQRIAESDARLFSLELIPRITRAQSMDVLSSMATVAGYRAVLLAAVELSKMFPLMMTAAGTLSPARVFVIGAGVAGLQAIATARRLGAVVRSYDVRPAVREQVESLGAKFVELQLQAEQSEDKGGYAKQMDEEFYTRQRALMAEVVSESDVVITTAAIPGKPSPLLITADAVKGMPARSVIVDLAAERGGNCELSEADRRVEEHNVVILGPTNLAGEVAEHASQMYSKNISTFLLNMIKEGELAIDKDDEIVSDTLVTEDGQVVHNRVRELLGMEPIVAEETSPEPKTSAESAENT
jgi:NAD(P) transhydrogenase subunit alpha